MKKQISPSDDELVKILKNGANDTGITALRIFMKQKTNDDVKRWALDVLGEFHSAGETWQDVVFRAWDRKRCRLGVCETELSHFKREGVYAKGKDDGIREALSAYQKR